MSPPMFGTKHQAEDGVGSFILSEIRDLRRGMEGRDGELRGEIAAVRDAVATLSESVSRSHLNVEGLRGDVDSMGKDHRQLRRDFDDLSRTHAQTAAKRDSAWDGPKKVLVIIAMVGAATTAVLAVLKFLPILGMGLLAIPTPQ
jgi:hypothetical protein